MKKILCIFLSAVMLICSFCIFADAKTTYKATWVMTANVNGKSYNSGTEIPVKPGDSVKVTVHLTNNYYTGPTCFQLFYTPTVIARASSGQFNTAGSFTACAETRGARWLTGKELLRATEIRAGRNTAALNSSHSLKKLINFSVLQ